MSNNNEAAIAIDIVRLQERTEQNNRDITIVQSSVTGLSSDVREIADKQSQSLLTLQKIETSLEYLNGKLLNHDKVDIDLARSVNRLELSHQEVSTKFRVVLAILAVIGTSIVGVLAKLLFFSPALGGG